MKRIIGIMTGNSMDAIDVVATEFSGNKITDIAFYSADFSQDMREKMDGILRNEKIKKNNISMEELNNDPIFIKIHDEYIEQVADAVNNMLAINNIDKKTIDAIGFHGKTLDHMGTGAAMEKGITPYTLQIGSGQMLANLTGIPVIYDFRSADVMNGGEGAPLAPTHNKNLAQHLNLPENIIFFNAGNISNISLMSGGKLLGWDAGPFNEFTDKLIRTHTNDAFDKDGKYGKQGTLNTQLLKKLFETGATIKNEKDNTTINFITKAQPKSGDPQYFHFDAISEFKNPVNFNDTVHTAEYFSGYVAAYTLSLIPENLEQPSDFVLFGGGWHNPVARQAFEDLLSGKGYVLPEHTHVFEKIVNRFKKQPTFVMSDLGKYMEARIFADTARYFLENKKWIPEPIRANHTPVVLGIKADPNPTAPINDRINTAANWKHRQSNQSQKPSRAQCER
ncbi:MAG: anhydro-N-acetylmuramic acid kinase [Lactobacillales bacterium]|jgi:anhydro-N-acetylmuramic acid kinase|nr:anhydro-N-acetylmuramic acid kinase [Lactobacillales bacterium]